MSVETINIILKFAPLAGMITAIIAVFAFSVALWQLLLARKNTMLNIAKNEIDIFAKLDERQKISADCMRKYNQLLKKNENKELELEYSSSQATLAEEQYLNLVDTICLYALNGNITKANFYKQYAKMLLTLEEIYSEELNQYENIKKVVLDIK